jgi:hypothetical protein
MNRAEMVTMTALLKNPLKNESPVDQTVDAARRRRAPQLADFFITIGVG